MNFLFDVRKYLARGSLLAVIGVAGEFAMAQAPVVQQHALTPGPQWNWDNLQDWSQQAAPSVQLSRLKEHIASLNVTLLEADNGASIVAATGAAHAKESVTDTLDRRYSRAYGQVGVRMSLLAAAEERQRAVSQARGALQTEAAQRRLLQMQSVTETGRMYVRYMRSQQREQMVAQFLRSQQEAAGVTRRRVAQGLMFKSEALELESLYEVAQARTAREQEIQRAALSQMAYLTGLAKVGKGVVAGEVDGGHHGTVLCVCLNPGAYRQGGLVGHVTLLDVLPEPVRLVGRPAPLSFALAGVPVHGASHYATLKKPSTLLDV